MISRLSQLIEDATRESPVVVIEGVTGTGKSELLHHIYTEHKKREGRLYYFSIQESQWSRKWRRPENFVEEIFEKDSHHAHIFIDDLHLLPSPLRFINAVVTEFEKRGCNTHVTATSGLKVSGTKTTKLAHAPVFFRVYGASIRDLIPTSAKRVLDAYTPLYTLSDRVALDQLYHDLTLPESVSTLSQVVRYGGLRLDSADTPQSDGDRIRELKSIRNKHFQKVIGPTCTLQRSFKCFAIAEYISQQTGRLLKEKDIEGAVHYPGHRVKKGLEVLLDSFLFQFSTPFFTDTRYETAKRPIVYATDPGIVMSFEPKQARTHIDKEQHILTFLYSEFLKQYQYDDIQYYRTIVGKQIPFILKRGKQIVPVGLSLGSDHAPQLSILKSFQRKYSDKTVRAVLLTDHTLDLTQEIALIPYMLAPFLCFIPLDESSM